MEILYRLEESDFLKFASEFCENKKNIIEYYKSEFYYIFLFILCLIVGSLLVNHNAHLGTIIIILFLYFIFLLFKPAFFARRIRNIVKKRLGETNIVGKLDINNESFSIYSSNYVVFFHKYQIKKLFKTENYYIFVINDFILSNTIIIPKKIFNTEEEKNNFENILNCYENKNKNVSNVALKNKNKFYFICLCLFFSSFYSNYINNLQPQNTIGIEISTVPIITNVVKGSRADNMGFLKGDVLLEVNNKSVKHIIPAIVSHVIQINPSKIKILRTQNAEVKDFDLTSNVLNR